MEESALYSGFILMLIGMTTVFTILSFVVIGGKITVAFTNRFASTKEEQQIRTMQTPDIASAKVAAITAAVETMTQGRGRIIEINKKE